MTKSYLLLILETYAIAIVGGIIFHLLQLPIPWLLGPLCTIMLWKIFSKRETSCPPIIKNGSFMLLGIYFGLSFTRDTFLSIGPYILPFMLLTFLLVGVCIVNAIFINKWFKIGNATSVLSSIPGGLTEMVAVGESLKGNVAMITIFQTVRLLTVVLLVPFVVVHLFTSSSVIMDQIMPTIINEYVSIFTYGWFILAMFIGWLVRNKIIAAYVIAPLFTIAIINTIGLPLPGLPSWVVLIAQLTIGIHIGSIMNVRDLKIGGKYSFIFFILTIVTISTSFLLGFIFSLVTNLSLSTAILSLAPGGLIEMVLTAKEVGADPAIVSSLQFTRLIIILLIIPPLLKWGFSKLEKDVKTEVSASINSNVELHK